MGKAAPGKKHRVRCVLKVPELTKAGSSVTFEISADGERIGTIVMGQGSITWYGGKRKSGTEFTWTKFAELMNDHCYGG